MTFGFSHYMMSAPTPHLFWDGNVGRLTFGANYNVELDLLALNKGAEPRHDDG